MGWLSGWLYRRKITITNNANTDATDYQVRIDLNGDNFNFGRASSDGSDIRFTKDDGTTPLNYWIESWDSANKKATVWVKVPNIPANGSIDIYVYYGNSSATSESDAEAVFDFFDDFEGDSIDTNKWVVTKAGTTSISVSNSILDVYTASGNSNNVYLGTKKTFSPPLIIEAKHQLKSSYTTRFSLSSSQTSEQAPTIRLELLYYSGYNSKIHSNNDSSEVSNTLANITGNIWHIVGIKTDGNTHIGFWDSHTASVTQSNSFQGYVLFRQVSAWNQSMESLTDWIRVRKYLDPEPSYTIGDEEIPLKYWAESTWKTRPEIYIWDGTSWKLAKAGYYWDGSKWVLFWKARGFLISIPFGSSEEFIPTTVATSTSNSDEPPISYSVGTSVGNSDEPPISTTLITSTAYSTEVGGE